MFLTNNVKAKYLLSSLVNILMIVGSYDTRLYFLFFL